MHVLDESLLEVNKLESNLDEYDRMLEVSILCSVFHFKLLIKSRARNCRSPNYNNNK